MHMKNKATESIPTDNGGIEMYRFQRPSLLSYFLLDLMSEVRVK